MKTVLIIVLILGVHLTTFSQNKEMEGNDEKAMKSVELPEIVVRNAGKDFSYYLPDKNPDPSVKKLQSDFVAYNLGKDYEGYDNFLVILEGEKGILTATYDANGKLTSVIEKYNNTQLPVQVIYSIYKAYPGWQIVNDKFLYSQENGNIKKKEYSLKLKKENEIIKLKVDPNGQIIANVD
ncbi:hypothetical protein [Flavobacterium gilvum]|uniref:Nicotinate-nucleotide adenylyltransferase n=1 Tax=Flavobacterium gilvum TaxID=1492737 RepID=A0AAC9N5J0_9FLAO|nr:hypothetical protein [Flavobacterium gilvum]AOW09477.1 hypothetical protein EM308_08175 [Flavobacterium gilvum]KFC60832.1 secreted protein [Flavobacterium gilvum]